MEDTQNGNERTNTEPVQQTNNRTAEESGKKTEGRSIRNPFVIFSTVVLVSGLIMWAIIFI